MRVGFITIGTCMMPEIRLNPRSFLEVCVDLISGHQDFGRF